MVADKPKVPLTKFTIEDNICKGEVIPFSSDYNSLGELLWTSINKYKNKIAQMDVQTDKVVTYSELQHKIVKCALWLQEQGIKPGDVVSICTNNHLDAIVPCLATTYINAIFNPWNEDMDMQTVQHVLQLAMPKVIFSTKKSLELILKTIKDKNSNAIVVVFGEHPGTVAFSDVLSSYTDTQVANFQYARLDGSLKKTVCILHSSGTTGMPKGVELSNECILRIIQDGNIALTNMVVLWFSALYWISGTILNVKSLSQGITIIVYPHFDEEMTCRLIEKYKVTWLFISTSMTNRFIRSEFPTKYSLSSLQAVLCGGAVLKPKAQEELKRILPHVQILQAYGMTESGGVVTMQYPYHKIGSCGTVIQNCKLKIVDPESGKILGLNQPGEICIKTETIMNGYYRNPEATKNSFDEEGWLRSGDVGYFDKDGELFIVDRLKDLIKYRGCQISPPEIEELLHTHPGILEVAIVGVPHPTDDEHPVAFVTVKSGFTVTEKELVDLVTNNLSDAYKLRAGVVFLDAFPYTGSGKIAKKDLKAMAKKLAVE